MKRLIMFLALLSLSVFVGCPDYSHLKEVPDYKNMTDGGGETLAGEDLSK